jgi:hypothetical protein
MIMVDESGNVTSATIGHPEQPWVPRRIESAAIAAALASRFAAPERDEMPIASWTQLVFQFKPNIRVTLTASDTELAVGDSISVLARITSDVRLDSAEVTIRFPADPHGGLTASGLSHRRSFRASLPLGKPVPVTARFAANACGSDRIGIECIAAGYPKSMTQDFLPLCIRGYPGSHLPEYRSPPGDSLRQAFRVDSRVLKQTADPCCSAPIPGAGD